MTADEQRSEGPMPGALRGLLLDLEGVLYQNGEAIPGAAEAVASLGRRGYALRYVTNTTTRPRHAIAQRLRALGFEARTEQVFSPSVAAVGVLRQLGARRIHLAAVPALAEDFAAFQVLGGETAERDGAGDYGAPGAAGAGVDAVVLGDLYRDFTWERLNGLFRLLADGAPLVALHRNRITRRAQGIALDLGPFVAALEYAAQVEARVVGKPSAHFFELAVDSLGCDRREVLMVGDDIESDIGGAVAAGLHALQVRTGKYRAGEDERAPARPAARIDSIAALPDWLAEVERGAGG